MGESGTAARIVELPYGPRHAFLAFHDRAERWACLVAHRRAGKTVACVNELVRAALSCQLTAPRFGYMAPTYSQAKDVAWTYLQRATAAVPGVTYHADELRADFPNAARIRLYGADNYDRLRGLYFDGVVLDEYGDMDPRAWPEVVRPALSDRGGWGVFIGTPKGNNHFFDMWEFAGKENWYRQMLRASETKLIPRAELLDAAKVMTREQYDQEYECSFSSAIVGAYYAREIADADRDGRIARVMWQPLLPVHTAWDLGMSDSTTCWFFQISGKEIHVLDYLENSGVGLGWYVNELKSRSYTYGDHLFPHDIEVSELNTGTTRKETLEGLGVRVTVVPKGDVPDGINAARMLLPRCFFNKTEAVDRGLTTLRNYRRLWDRKRKVFHDRPHHDWASHGADAWRYLATGLHMIAATDGWSKPLKYDTKGYV